MKTSLSNSKADWAIQLKELVEMRMRYFATCVEILSWHVCVYVLTAVKEMLVNVACLTRPQAEANTS